MPSRSCKEMKHNMKIVFAVLQMRFLPLPLLPQAALRFLPLYRAVPGDRRGKHANAGAVGENHDVAVLIGNIAVLRRADKAVGKVKRVIAAKHTVGQRHIALALACIRRQLIHGRLPAVFVFGADDADAVGKVVNLLPAR